MFKVGDWVIYEKGKGFETARVEIVGQIPNYIGVSTGENVPLDECGKWQPQESEWCWYGYELVQVIDAYNLDYVKICRQNSSSYEEINYITLEPFIGELPSFIKESK